MSKGSDYTQKLDQILGLLYERGAIGGTEVVKLHEIQEAVGVDEGQAWRLMKLLMERKLVEAIVPKVFRLTGAGFDEAARLAHQSSGQGAAAPARPLGFPEPGQREGDK